MKQKLIRAIHALRKEFSFHGYKIKIYRDPEYEFTVRFDVFLDGLTHEEAVIVNKKITDISKNLFEFNRYKLPFPDLHICAYGIK